MEKKTKSIKRTTFVAVKHTLWVLWSLWLRLDKCSRVWGQRGSQLCRLQSPLRQTLCCGLGLQINLIWFENIVQTLIFFKKVLHMLTCCSRPLAKTWLRVVSSKPVHRTRQRQLHFARASIGGSWFYTWPLYKAPGSPVELTGWGAAKCNQTTLLQEVLMNPKKWADSGHIRRH